MFFTPYQNQILMKKFQEKKTFLDMEEKYQLSKSLNISQKRVDSWFCHRRQKERRGKLFIKREQPSVVYSQCPIQNHCVVICMHYVFIHKLYVFLSLCSHDRRSIIGVGRCEAGGHMKELLLTTNYYQLITFNVNYICFLGQFLQPSVYSTFTLALNIQLRYSGFVFSGQSFILFILQSSKMKVKCPKSEYYSRLGTTFA